MMSLVYESFKESFHAGYRMYALRHDGQWFSRFVAYTRAGDRSQGAWRPVYDDMQLSLTKAVNPDDPPNVIDQIRLRRVRLSVRLPAP